MLLQRLTAKPLLISHTKTPSFIMTAFCFVLQVSYSGTIMDTQNYLVDL
jgi:hypothetical protein